MTKETRVIEREGCFGYSVKYIARFQNEMKQDMIVTIEKYGNQLFVGQLNITGHLTDTKGRFSGD